MLCPGICVYVTPCCHQSKLKIAAIVNRMLIFLYCTVRDVCIIISFYLSFWPRNINLDFYRSFVVPGSFMASINLLPRNFEFLRILFSCTYSKALNSSKPLITSEITSRAALQLYLGSNFCRISTGNCCYISALVRQVEYFSILLISFLRSGSLLFGEIGRILSYDEKFYFYRICY